MGGRLTKATATLHTQAQNLVDADRPLTEAEREFVLAHWHEAGAAAHNLSGAYFTPIELAYDLVQFHTVGRRILDLGAGIGRLAYAAHQHIGCNTWDPTPGLELVCVERNPDYVRVGRRVLPEAVWVQADAFDLPADLGVFDCVISNPPFGATSLNGHKGPRYTGRRAEYHLLDIAADLAPCGLGAFIVPQSSAPFAYSGVRQSNWDGLADSEYRRFVRETGIELGFNVGIDTSVYLDQWRGVAPSTEIVIADFRDRGRGDLYRELCPTAVLAPAVPMGDTPDGALF